MGVIVVHYPQCDNKELSRQGEFHGETEVVGGGGIAAGREQRGVGLTLVISRERQQARQRIISHERHLEC